MVLRNSIDNVTSSEKTPKREAMKGKSNTSDIVFSRHTNKPINPDAKITKEVVFWCSVCNCRVNTNDINLRHFIGKSHKKNLNMLKRPLPNGSDNNGPAAKKANIAVTSKSAPASSASTKSVPPDHVKCEDCKLEFKNHNSAIMHLKGKKHKSVVTQSVLKRKDDAKKSSLSGRGRGAGGGLARGGQRGGGRDKFNFGSSSTYNPPKFDLMRVRYLTDDQGSLPIAAKGASGSLLRRKLVRALLEEEERWIGNDSLNGGATSAFNNSFSGDGSAGTKTYHDTYSNPYGNNNTNNTTNYNSYGSYGYNNY